MDAMLYCLSRYFSVDCYALLFTKVFICWLLRCIVYQGIYLLAAMLYCLSWYLLLTAMLYFLSRYFSVGCYAVLFIKVFFLLTDMLYRLSNMVYFCWLLCCNVYHSVFGECYIKRKRVKMYRNNFFYFNVYINHLVEQSSMSKYNKSTRPLYNG